MSKIFLVIVALIILGVGISLLQNDDEASVVTQTNNQATTTNATTTAATSSPLEVIPVSHATAFLEWDGVTLLTDPVGTSTQLQARSPQIILLTDIHGDHLSTSTLDTMGSTTLVVPQAVFDRLTDAQKSRARILDNGERITIREFEIEAIPMYNLPETADSRHTKGRGNGYVIEHDDYRVYIAGDTSGIPEMRALTNIDMAFVPMNLPFTMSVEDAADAVIDFEPRIVYPYHYRGEGGLADVNKFKSLVDAADVDTEVRLVNWYPAQ